MAIPLRRCNNVGDFIEELNKVPRESQLIVVGPDIGGYDVTSFPFGYVNILADGSIMIDHNEHEAWQRYEEGKITYEEFSASYPTWND